jgi:uncharacterized membrane protein YjfL (UPF0719 family)
MDRFAGLISLVTARENERNCKRRNNQAAAVCFESSTLGYSIDLISTAKIEFLSLIVKMNVSD